MAKVDISLALPEIEGGTSPMEMAIDSRTPSRFPHFHYEGPEELPIPDEGCMTVKYKITWKQEEETDGKEVYRCKVELREICEAEGKTDDRPAKTDRSAEDALDAIRKQLEATEGESD
jgi:hypothetical protein